MSEEVTAIVVDDSQFMRASITDILQTGGVSVLAEASDGAEGVEAVLEHEPDVVTMDVEMPGMDGIEAVDRIMSERPTPVLMLSAHTGEDANVTFEALERGAVDFFEKPSGEISIGLSRSEEQLLETVRSVAAATPTVPSDDRPAGAQRSAPDPGSLPEQPTLVIGASTGGPNVVERTIAGLPAGDFRILVVQHMPETFTEGFAKRLDDRSEYRVGLARDGNRIGAGEALVAPGDRHLEVTGYRGGLLQVGLTDAPDASVSPAIDVTMRSAARQVSGPLVAAILTGMGDDGQQGVAAVKEAGGYVVAQDEASSAVFGMPKRAIETGCVDDIRSAGELATGIVEVLANDPGPTPHETEVSPGS